jgi:hypothetical protein
LGFSHVSGWPGTLTDKRISKLIRGFLSAGVLADGLVTT